MIKYYGFYLLAILFSLSISNDLFCMTGINQTTSESAEDIDEDDENIDHFEKQEEWSWIIKTK